uniref:uncharacterized protein LOC120328352 n=1 Tax=Styela clava TaxID=7725 RepID=UPI001939C033|nr:uncharacterized protein LOC120328352 [Styela clava]XP_039250750.1 uncharacterized protein LOC120328352 [Styela clava]
MNPKITGSLKTDQADRLMTSLARLRENKVLCDFKINVENKSFLVHRNVLISSSAYFESMLFNNMKEATDGFVNMTEVTAVGISECIQFMYLGTVDLRMDNLRDILNASDILQLLSLTNYCLQYLKSNISLDNCLFVLNLAHLYSRDDIKQAALKIVTTNFEAVISDELFPSINEATLANCIKVSRASHEALWKAVITWVQGSNDAHQQHILELVQALNLKKFPCRFVLETILKDPLVNGNKPVESFVVFNLFSDIEERLEIDTCFALKSLLQKYKMNGSDNWSKIELEIHRFIRGNLQHMMNLEEFGSLSDEEIVFVVKSGEGIHSLSSSNRWQAAMMWINHDVLMRKKTLPKLIRIIDLKQFSVDFLRENVRCNTLVTESHECKDLLIDELFRRINTDETKSGNTSQPIFGFGKGFSTQKSTSQSGFGFGKGYSASKSTGQSVFGLGPGYSAPKTASQSGFGFGTGYSAPKSTSRSGWSFGIGYSAPKSTNQFGFGFGTGYSAPKSTSQSGCGFGTRSSVSKSTGQSGFGLGTGFSAPKSTSKSGSGFVTGSSVPKSIGQSGFGFGTEFSALKSTSKSEFAFGTGFSATKSTSQPGSGFGTGFSAPKSIIQSGFVSGAEISTISSTSQSEFTSLSATTQVTTIPNQFNLRNTSTTYNTTTATTLPSVFRSGNAFSETTRNIHTGKLEQNQHITVLNRISGGQMNIHPSELYTTEFGWCNYYVINYSFSAGTFEGIPYSAQKITAYLPIEDGVIQLIDYLRLAFNAGMIFKIEKQSDGRGTITWKDIPHKTTIDGGLDNNGYPDTNYLNELRESLKLKLM